ncbi:MAG TPA: glutamate 5-kinase [Verrucomicrobiales bacterium]|nr:glutamate 5-kinase [Verrucomicrobiales bacterium]
MRRRVVIKFGSGILTTPDRVDLDAGQFEGLVAAVAGIRRGGVQCVLVSSGAVAAGLPAFRLENRPADTAMLQACAAVGQTRLMHFYETLFRQHKLTVAQLLLTHEDLREDTRRRNFQNTLERLLAFDDTVPIINENDSVSVEELRYGDNDLLSADVAVISGADCLVLLTTVDGLLPPGKTNGEDIVRTVENIGEVQSYALEEHGRFSVGGMQSKLRAVDRAVTAGIETFIANGRRPEQLEAVLAGRGHATRFVARAKAEPAYPALEIESVQKAETPL